MPQLQGVQGLSPQMANFCSLTRLFMRDHPELNRLVDGEESSDRMIAWAALDALSNFNGTPHFTQFSLEELIELHQQHLMMRMTVCSLIESVGLLQTRNHINASDGGINAGINDKTPLLMKWLEYFKASTEQKLQRVKVAINIGSILGPSNSGVHSELWAVNASYLSY